VDRKAPPPPTTATTAAVTTTITIMMKNYMNTNLPKELMICIALSMFGWYGPSMIIQPMIGGITMTAVPYQVLSNSGDVVLDSSLNYPAIENVTIPSNLLIHTTITLPLLLVLIVTALCTRRSSSQESKYHDLHSAVCVILISVATSEFTTQVIKSYVGRLRPNFYHLCEFDITKLQCTATQDIINEARSSFPSGHSSLSFSGMGCLVWLLLGRSQKSNNKTQIVMAFLPWTYACFVACSRIVDKWHHPSDVLAGSLIGIFASTLSYHLWYPNLYSQHAGTPVSLLTTTTTATITSASTSETMNLVEKQ